MSLKIINLVELFDNLWKADHSGNPEIHESLSATIEAAIRLAVDTGEKVLVGEMSGTLLESAAELIDEAFRQIACRVETGDMAGWWDSMALSTACDLGDWLADYGTWERHSDGVGRRWFYREKQST
jgi:hypothetical protein